jgi:hypothetical protein
MEGKEMITETPLLTFVDKFGMYILTENEKINYRINTGDDPLYGSTFIKHFKWKLENGIENAKLEVEKYLLEKLSESIKTSVMYYDIKSITNFQHLFNVFWDNIRTQGEGISILYLCGTNLYDRWNDLILKENTPGPLIDAFGIEVIKYMVDSKIKYSLNSHVFLIKDQSMPVNDCIALDPEIIKLYIYKKNNFVVNEDHLEWSGAIVNEYEQFTSLLKELS